MHVCFLIERSTLLCPYSTTVYRRKLFISYGYALRLSFVSK